MDVQGRVSRFPMLDAGVSLRDVQIAARHADPRTTTASYLSATSPPRQ
jgi:hypothetical protein